MSDLGTVIEEFAQRAANDILRQFDSGTNSNTRYFLTAHNSKRQRLYNAIRNYKPTNIKQMATICLRMHYKFGCKNAATCGCFVPVWIMIAETGRFNYQQDKRNTNIE